MTTVSPDRGLDVEIELSKKLRILYMNFMDNAKRIGSQIIRELNVHTAKKTIKPFSSHAGFAGGEKFICEGIFFKYATDKHHMYGGIEFAMKTAAHELKSLKAMLHQNVPKLNFPIMGVISAYGYKLIAGKKKRKNRIE